MKPAHARCCEGREQAGSCLPKRFCLLLCSRWLLGHFGQQDWKRATVCSLHGVPTLVFGEFEISRLPCPDRVILDAVLLCQGVLVCFGSDLLLKLLNARELSVVTHVCNEDYGWSGGSKVCWAASSSGTHQPHAKGRLCHAVVTADGTEGYCP